MEVHRIENANGSTLKVQFVRTDEPDFKAAIKAWMQENYPDMSFQEFFDRLEEFQGRICRIKMA